MKLDEALQLNFSGEPPQIAYVGAGGKTSAMFQTAYQLSGDQYATVFVTTTTHLAVNETKQGDQVVQLDEKQSLRRFFEQIPKGVVVVCGPKNDDRVQGLSPSQLEDLYLLSEEHQIPLLIEADGSRRRPLKAPDRHEPVIPGFVSLVVVVAGLTGVGHPLNKETVHRPDRFAQLAGIDSGEIISPESLAKVLAHPEGGLKGIPPNARKVLFLNQANEGDAIRFGHDIARFTVNSFRRVIIGDLYQTPKIIAVHEPIAGMILAAGSSSRFNGPKQLAIWHGKTFLQNVIQVGLDGGLNPLIVVIGAFKEEIRESLSDYYPSDSNSPIRIVENPDWQEGQSTSIRTGLNQLPKEVGGVVFLLADQPTIPMQLVRRLQEVRAATQAWIVVPRFKGQRANPVLFGRELFDQLRQIKGDQGGRVLMREPCPYPLTWLDWDDPSLVFDVDTWDDYKNLMDGYA